MPWNGSSAVLETIVSTSPVLAQYAKNCYFIQSKLWLENILTLAPITGAMTNGLVLQSIAGEPLALFGFKIIFMCTS